MVYVIPKNQESLINKVKFKDLSNKKNDFQTKMRVKQNKVAKAIKEVKFKRIEANKF